MWRSLAWPDVGANWYFSAVRTARPLLEHAPEAALVSVSPLFTAVAAGHALMRGNAQRRWIIDLGDPFSFLADSPPNNRLLYAGLNARFERAAFGRAAAVSVTNARTAACYAAAFPESAGKLHVIPPLLSAPLAPGASKRTGGPVRIVFLGTLYRGLREPDFLLALFAAARADASPMELHFYGEAGDCAGALERYRETCAGGIHLHGVVSRDEALAATREADVLVNLGNRTAFQLPSKVVEYAAAGKPVVNIATHRDDSSIEFFRPYPLALNIISERGAPEAAQVAQFREFVQRTQAAEAAALEAFLRPYRIEQVAAEYARLIA
jgi:glycosyltransferase involved in cell wall biosynthesis